MKPCVCVVIVLFSHTITRLGIFMAFYSKTQKMGYFWFLFQNTKNTNQHLGHSYFTDFLDLFLMSGNEKKLK